MPRVLIFFGTFDSHTAKIANILREDLQDAGASVHLVDAGTGHSDPRPQDYDAVIIAASLHLGTYERAVRDWVRAHHCDLSGMPSAFLSVCLVAPQPAPGVEQELTTILENFLETVGWRPTLSRQVAGAIPYTRFGWFKRWTTQRMARQAGLETDPTQDYEFTDWVELRAFAQSFVPRVERTRRVLALH